MYVCVGETVIGREDKCGICILASSLSRQHAIILVEGDSHFVQDLGSRNKTYRKSVSRREGGGAQMGENGSGGLGR